MKRVLTCTRQQQGKRCSCPSDSAANSADSFPPGQPFASGTVMSTEAEFSEQFYDNSKKFFSERVDYASVTALLLYWEDNDFHPEEEVDAIRELFERDFGFSSLTFSIPSRRAQQELNREISAFVSNYSNKVDSLILVYYAGHGDVEDDGKSVWAACVQWSPQTR